MARTARSVVADRIRIEDEVWDEAFASRVRSRPPRTGRPLTPVSAQPVFDLATDLDQRGDPPPRRDLPPRPDVRRRPEPAPAAEPAPAVVTLHPRTESAAGDASRRTIRIQGRGAERNLPVSSRERRRPPHESAYFRPDKLAMWAVLLGFLLVAAAILSAHA